MILGGGKPLFEGFTRSIELKQQGKRQSTSPTFIEYRVKRRGRCAEVLLSRAAADRRFEVNGERSEVGARRSPPSSRPVAVAAGPAMNNASTLQTDPSTTTKRVKSADDDVSRARSRWRRRFAAYILHHTLGRLAPSVIASGQGPNDTWLGAKIGHCGKVPAGSEVALRLIREGATRAWLQNWH